MSDSNSLNLSFLARDVRNQLVHSRELLDQVELLRKSLPKIEDTEARTIVESSIKNLLTIVQNMSANVTLTTATGTATITSSSATAISTTPNK